MKKRIIYILTALLFFTSCNNWLNVTPKSMVDREKNFETEDGFKRALIGCYSKLKLNNLYGQQMTMTVMEFLAQHWFNVISTDKAYDYIVPLLSYDYTNEEVKKRFKSIYGDLYNVITQSNDILAHLELKEGVIASPDSRDIIEAEALAMRAFCHFDILRLFGQMPTNPQQMISLPYVETVSRENHPYSSNSEFVAKIERDLLKAELLLKETDPVFQYPFENSSIPSGVEDDFFAFRRTRFNYYAVKALQARFYLYTNQPTKAYNAAKVVINAKDENGNRYLTLAGAGDFAKENYSLPSEGIMILSSFKMEKDVHKLFRNKDEMLHNNKNNIFNDVFGALSTHNRYSNLWYEYTTGAGITIASLKKYWQDTDSEGNVDLLTKQTIPLLRLSEVFLIAIETAPTMDESNRLMTEYSNARNLLPVVYENEDDLKVEIMKEYRREFYAEGQMFFTYKRLGSEDILWYGKEMTENQYIIPLPNTEINPN